MKNNNNNKLNWASLFTNKNGGKPLYKNGEPILDKEGLNVLAANFQCILNVKEPLPTGEYVIQFREKMSQSGNLYYGGAIKLKEQENKPNQHQDYQPDTRGLVKPVIEDQEIIDDTVPF
jgi:hypothetical protein